MNWYGDFETTGLSAKDGDILLLACFIPSDSDDVVIMANGDVPFDDGLVLNVTDWFDARGKSERVFGYNWFGYDLRFLNQRIIAAGGWPKAWSRHYDLLDETKKKFPYLPDHKLDTVAHALGVANEKTALDLEINRRCADGVDDREAWSLLIEHCVADVKVTRDVYEKMYGL